MRRMHLQRQRSHQRTNRNQARGENKPSPPRDHIRDVSKDNNTQNSTDDQRIADPRLHLRRIARVQQMLENDICRVGEAVLESVAEVGDVLVIGLVQYDSHLWTYTA